MSLSASVASICDKYITVVGAFRTIATYLEINVAGFRKILKQINKQLPGYVLIDAIDLLVTVGLA